MPDVRLVVNGSAYGGWKRVRIQRGMEQVANTFELGVSELWPGQDLRREISDGDRCEVLVDGTAVITGYVDDVAIAYDSKQHTVDIAGRDATGDLVDCSAMRKGGQWTGQTMERIAVDLCAPFGIGVRAEVSTGKAFATFALQEGESAFEALERMARIRGLLLVSDGAGGLVITRAGTSRVPTALVLGENILSARGSKSQRDRYSDYMLKGQAAGTDTWNGKAASQVKATAKDPAVRRYRPMLIVSESQGDSVSLADRAIWEATVRAARATTVAVRVQGWAHAAGLWQPNRIVRVRDSWMRLDDDLLIKDVVLTLDEMGFTSELSLTRKDAYTLLPQKDPVSSGATAAGNYWSLPPKGAQ